MRSDAIPFRLGLLMVALCLSGCGKKEFRKPCFPVSGKVLSQNKPAVGAMVILHPLDDAEIANWPTGYPRGVVGEDGVFRIGTYESADGAPTGNYVAKIEWPTPNPKDEEDTSNRDRLRGRYLDPKKSPFPVPVPQSPLELKPFEVK